MKKLITLSLLLFIALACEREDLQVDRKNETSARLLAEDKIPLYVVRLRQDGIGLEPRTGASNSEAQVDRIAREICARIGISNPERVQGVYARIFSGFAVKLDPKELALMRRQKEVEVIEEESVFSLAQVVPAKGKNIALPNQIVPWGIQKVRAYATTSSRTAWILDTGIDLNHPDLNVDVSRSRSFLPWQFYELDAQDLNGHGTHVAGIIGALDNAFGVVGISPGVRLVAVKVMSKNGVGQLSAILRGLEYVLASAAPGDVVNVSLSGNRSALMDSATESLGRAGIRVIIAAGNLSRDVSTVSPARVNAPNIYTVSAINQEEVFAPFSNFGAGVDFAEPGVDIVSTYLNGSYAVLSGTSLAAPHLAGLLLLDNKAPMTVMGYAKNDPDGIPDPIGGQ